MRPPQPLMIFAAGFGTRMGPLTADRPKPMIPVGGRPMIDRALDLAAGAGAGPVVVNLHYRGQQIADHLAGRGVLFSWETDRILDTGGGLAKALPMLGPGPVLTLNPDAVWTGPNPLVRLMAAFDPARMEVLLMLSAEGGGTDFTLDAGGHVRRHNGGAGRLYLGAQMLRPDRLAEIAGPVFSLNRFWDACIARGTAFGLVHPGGWCDVGRPEGLGPAEAMLREAGDG
jgi:MurNAc alpha-1-phosphate uridylyltransferase